jgi:hypothetical protein
MTRMKQGEIVLAWMPFAALVGYVCAMLILCERHPGYHIKHEYRCHLCPHFHPIVLKSNERSLEIYIQRIWHKQHVAIQSHIIIVNPGVSRTILNLLSAVQNAHEDPRMHLTPGLSNPCALRAQSEFPARKALSANFVISTLTDLHLPFVHTWSKKACLRPSRVPAAPSRIHLLHNLRF